MSNQNTDLIRRAYQAYANDDLTTMPQVIDPDLEWTYLDPTLEHPTPQVCYGRRSWRTRYGNGPSMACGPSWRRSLPTASWSWWACGR
jgi:ketosteroid isomerase-like protein